MGIEYAHNGDVRLAYETFGPSSGWPLLLVMGLDFQMVWWPDGFCEALVERGFQVARFDNRDTGLSTGYPEVTGGSPVRALFRGAARPAYTGFDLVDDCVAVTAALGWGSAHVVGASLGAAVATYLALLHPERVRTLVGMMGAPARRLDTVRYVNPLVFPRFARIRQPATPEGGVRTLVEIARVLSSPQHPFDEEWARAVAEVSEARRPRSRSTAQRQLAALRATGDLARRIHEITTPALFVTGADDPLVRPSGARALAKRLPNARAVVVPAMGHLIPEHTWEGLADAIAEHALAAEESSDAA